MTPTHQRQSYFDSTLQFFWDAALQQCPWMTLTPTHLTLDAAQFPFNIHDEELFSDIHKHFKWMNMTVPTQKHVRNLKGLTLHIPLKMLDEVKNPFGMIIIEKLEATVWAGPMKKDTHSEKLVTCLMKQLEEILNSLEIQNHPLASKFQECFSELQDLLENLPPENDLFFAPRLKLNLNFEKLFPLFGCCHITAFDALFSSCDFKSLASDIQKTRSKLLNQVMPTEQDKLSDIFEGRLWKHYVKLMQKLLLSHARGELKDITGQRSLGMRLCHTSHLMTRQFFCRLLYPIQQILSSIKSGFYTRKYYNSLLIPQPLIEKTLETIKTFTQTHQPSGSGDDEYNHRSVEFLIYQMIFNSPPILLCTGGFLIRSTVHRTIHLSPDLLAAEITQKVLGYLPKESQWNQGDKEQEQDDELDNSQTVEGKEHASTLDTTCDNGEMIWNTVREKTTQNFGFLPNW